VDVGPTVLATTCRYGRCGAQPAIRRSQVLAGCKLHDNPVRTLKEHRYGRIVNHTMLMASVLMMAGAVAGTADSDAVPAGFKSDTAKLSDASIHYVRGGSGPPLLLVHGFPEDWYEYHAIMPRLAKRFTVISVDLRGVGGSSASSGRYDAVTMAQDLQDLMTALKLHSRCGPLRCRRRARRSRRAHRDVRSALATRCCNLVHVVATSCRQLPRAVTLARCWRSGGTDSSDRTCA
jgi:hypothetical protein